MIRKALVRLMALVAMTAASKLSAHDEGEGSQAGKNVGPGKAVLQANDQGFLLREGVETRIGIMSLLIASSSPVIPKDALVYSKDEHQVFRKRSGFWKAIDVQVKRQGHTIRVQGPQLQPGDAIAIKAAGLLKVIELSVIGSEGESPIH
jgi:hypothetical protein